MSIKLSEERLAQGFSTTYADNGTIASRTTFCSRSRCNNRIFVDLTQDNTFVLEYGAIVVSMNDGHKRRVFCTEKCAALWLNQKDHD